MAEKLSREPKRLPAIRLSLLCLSTVHKVGTTILLPTVLVVLSANGAVLSVGYRGDVIPRNPEVAKITLRGIGAPVAQAEVVFLAPSFVAMTLHGELDVCVLFEPV